MRIPQNKLPDQLWSKIARIITTGTQSAISVTHSTVTGLFSFAINVDDSTIETNIDNDLQVKNGGITQEKLNNNVITGQSSKTALIGTDKFLISDSADSNELKYTSYSDIFSSASMSALSVQLTAITHTEPSSLDYAIQNLVNSSPYGFATQDEGNTVLKVIANLQKRMQELENRLQNLGLLQ